MPLWHSKCIGNTNFKRIKPWLTELQKTAQHADHAWQSALQAQFQKVTSTRSTLTYASTAVHVQMLAQWVQSFLSNLSTKEKRPEVLKTSGLFLYVSAPYFFGADTTCTILFCAMIA